ncbi:L,D-transpeptidase [Rhodoblastus acidophilus]|uniref:L,D-transpeptidase n=1 Tax=Candidatus Rhodoblastus alkanivorans TaxID=2954117 RepID=A0ABS9Z2L9_9HYPH|nr:L,D-transpeptidase [Candidatus Rhodoblastus alkanivorans]MCI4681904.1 L,D-transpeptidase [Candidatus Rhodoblastus alkanivorans]MDI4642954.1 L,D-transpeptidase [Rhodoblastus acidophilus]
MKPHFFSSAAVCGLALCLAPPAPAQAGNLGGGFIEFLVTGGKMAPRAVQPRVMAYARPTTYAPSGVLVNHVPSSDMQASLSPVQPSREVSPEFTRREIDYPAGHKVGSIVIDTPNHYLYLVTTPGHAIRYGIGVGRPGFTWSGYKTITRKAEWPGWTPPADMLKRRPDLPRHMDGGPDNPLGARALYLGSSMYRIHGTNQPWTIGQNVSSGCIRMMNDDVIDLYNRVHVGAPVDVL